MKHLIKMLTIVVLATTLLFASCTKEKEPTNYNAVIVIYNSTLNDITFLYSVNNIVHGVAVPHNQTIEEVILLLEPNTILKPLTVDGELITKIGAINNSTEKYINRDFSSINDELVCNF